jgi:signal transduction histidine kinase
MEGDALMMHEFLARHRVDLIARCRDKVAQRPTRSPTAAQLEHGIPLFLEQLIRTLKVEQSADPMHSQEISGPSGGVKPFRSEIGTTAAKHGKDLFNLGYTIDQVVHDYGDLCQSIGDLAVELNEPFEIDEFRTLNRCLDNGIADAVTEFNYERDASISVRQEAALNERLSMFAHELRNHLSTASLAFAAIKLGNVGVNGATGAVLERTLLGLKALINRSLTEVRITAGMPVQHNLFSLSDFVGELRLSASLESQSLGCTFSVGTVDPQLAIDADRDLMLSAVSNLLHNAFKFTHAHTEVQLNAYAAGDRILIDVKDHCGGLPLGDVERLFLPFIQRVDDFRGVGLGLSIARRSVETNGGIVSVRDIPGFGCVFTIDMPRHILGGEAATNVDLTPGAII